jgi:hypothetical protein
VILIILDEFYLFLRLSRHTLVQKSEWFIITFNFIKIVRQNLVDTGILHILKISEIIPMSLLAY